MGRNITVTFPLEDGNATVNFFEITTAGNTHIEPLVGGPPIELPGYGGARFFDIRTTAAFGEPIMLCLPYDPADFVGRPARILHYKGGEWEDLTLTNDPVAGKVCAEPARLLPLRARARVDHGPDRADHLRAGPAQRDRHARRSSSPPTCPAP